MASEPRLEELPPDLTDSLATSDGLHHVIIKESNRVNQQIINQKAINQKALATASENGARLERILSLHFLAKGNTHRAMKHLVSEASLWFDAEDWALAIKVCNEIIEIEHSKKMTAWAKEFLEKIDSRRFGQKEE